VTVTQGTASVTWSGSHSAVNAGFAIGGGGEWAFADRWTAEAEYLWYDLGNASHALNCTSSSFAASCSSVVFYSTLGSAVSSFHGSIVRFGINYRFN
jgi:outer membrane immunogenic protein